MLLHGHLTNPNLASQSPRPPVSPPKHMCHPLLPEHIPWASLRCPCLLGQKLETPRIQFRSGFSWSLCLLILKCALCQTNTGLWVQSPTRLEIPERQRQLSDPFSFLLATLALSRNSNKNYNDTCLWILSN